MPLGSVGLGGRRLAALLVLVAFASPHVAEAGLLERLKNKNKRVERRQLSEADPAVDVDIEASTGTVRKIVSEAEEAAAQAERTCDGQMAVSLVKANDEKLHAETEREAMRRERDDARQELSELKAKLWDTTDKLTKELTSTTNNLNNKIEQLEQALATTDSNSSKKIREMQSTANARYEALETDSKQRLESADAKHKEQFEASKASYEARIAEMTEAHAKTVTDMEAQQKVIMAEAEDKWEKGLERMTEFKTKSDNEFKAEIAELKEQLETQAATLKKDGEGKVAEVAAQLESTKAQMEKSLADLQQQAKDAADKAAAQAKTEKDELVSKAATEKKALETKLAQAESKAKSLSADSRALKVELKEVVKDLEHWKSLHGARSYCNLTHISEDATVVAYAATDTASKSVRQLARQTSERALKLKDETLKASKPYVKKAQELYETHLKQHVEAARPHYDNYAAPVVGQAAVMGAQYHQEYGVPAYVAAKQYTKELFDDTLRPTLHRARVTVEDTFAKECPQALKATRKAAKDLDVKLPKLLDTNWDKACKNPKITVKRFFQVIAFIILYMLRYKIFYTIIWMIKLPFRVLWFFSPLRFIFGSPKKAPPAAAATEKAQQPIANGNGTNGVSVKKKKGKK